MGLKYHQTLSSALAAVNVYKMNHKYLGRRNWPTLPTNTDLDTNDLTNNLNRLSTAQVFAQVRVHLTLMALVVSTCSDLSQIIGPSQTLSLKNLSHTSD